MPERYDLHTHLFTTWEQGRLSLERASRDPDYVLDAVRNAGLDGIVLANFGDYRYEQFVDSLKERKGGKYRISKELSNALVFESDDVAVKIIKGQEVPTKHGHLLVLAQDYGTRILTDQTLLKDKEIELAARGANASGSVVVPCHWWGFGGIGKNRLLENAENFHAFEEFNGNYSPPSPEDIEEIRTQTSLFGIATSDSHNRKDLGNGYIEIFEDLDFSSADNLKESLKNTLLSGEFKFEVRKRNPLASRFGHAAIIGYDVFIRRKFKLLEGIEI